MRVARQLAGEKNQTKPKLLDHPLLKAEVFHSFIPLDENFVKSVLKLTFWGWVKGFQRTHK